MKKLVFIFLFVFAITPIFAQQKLIDSLSTEGRLSTNDTLRMILYGQLSDAYSEINPDSSFVYASKMLKITRELNLKLEEAVALGQMGYSLINMANYPRSLQLLLEAIAILENPASESPILSEEFPSTDEFTDRTLTPNNQRISKLARVSQYAGIVYTATENYRKGIDYFKQSMAKAVQSGNKHIVTTTYTSMGRAYLAMKELDSALISLQHGYNTAIAANYPRYLGSLLLNMGRAYISKNQPQTARYFLKQSLQVSKENGYFRGVAVSNLMLAEIAKKAGLRDSTIYYLNNALFWGKVVNLPDVLLRNYTALTDFYTGAGNTDSVVKYQSLIIKINDSLFNAKQAHQFQNIDFDDQQRHQQVEAAKTAYRNKVRQNVLLGGAVVFLLTAFILFRNNRQKQKANQLLAEEKSKVESTLLELKSAQMQLIQSEKMASLGELTAGIAHEIQNPLNFINNFSEVNKDLLTEMKVELEKGNHAEAKIIADDIVANGEKIHHHGKRADAIVKGMMQHSKRNSGIEEPVNINALADEYFRLAYHGLRDKDNTLHINLKTDFDKEVGNISVVPQDISSVLVNFYNNAFYSVKEKQRQLQNGYEPTVTVSTKKRDNKIEITVKDNGEGIPEKVLDKIFQPFFTTKPVGKGTGLGLSLSYDIIKAHRGEIKVNNQPGEGVEFVISLPED